MAGSHTPRENHLLAALPREDYERLLPHLKPMPLTASSVVHAAGKPERFLCFICEGIVCRYYVMQSGASAGVSVIGNEGVAGIASFLGGESTPCEAVALSNGYAYRLGADALKNELTHGGALLQLLLQYTMALIAQTGQGVVCSRHHSLEQRLCGWILSCLDRQPSSELTMTQELIAHMLGVRREGVTQAAGHLQQAGLIHCHRGHITVLDRARLEAHACECHAVVTREYRRLLPQSPLPGLQTEHSGQNVERQLIFSVSPISVGMPA